MTQPYASDLCKEYVLSVYPSAKVHCKGMFFTIQVANLQIGTGFSAAAAWVAAKYYIMSQQDKKKENAV